MKTCSTLICILLTITFAPLQAASDTFVDYQNYNHGYCPKCNCYPCQCKYLQGTPGPGPVDGPEAIDDPDADDDDEDYDDEEGDIPPPPACRAPAPATTPCDDPAPVCATNCGVSLCVVGVAIAAIATTAAILISANNGGDPAH